MPIIKRRVSVRNQHVEVYVEQAEPGVWKATGEFAGKVWSITGKSANRAVSDWAVAVSRLEGK